MLAKSVNAREHDHLLLLARDRGQLTQLRPTQSTHDVYGGAFLVDEILLFHDEGHGVFRRSNVEAYLPRSAAFLDRTFREGTQHG